MARLTILILTLCATLAAATYNIGPGKTYTNIGDAPWTSFSAGDTVNIYPKTAFTAVTAAASTGTTLTLATSAASIPYGSSVWFSGMSGTSTWVTCGVYGSGLYGTATGGTACADTTVTLADPVTVGEGVTIYFTPPYYERIVLTSSGTAESPIIIQGVADPTTGALPVLDAHNATTGPHMAHSGVTNYHDRYGFILLIYNAAQTSYPQYVTLKSLRIQGARISVVFYDGDNAGFAFGGGVGGLRTENADHVTFDSLEFFDNENGLFGNSSTSTAPPQFTTNLTVSRCHFYRNGLGSGAHQSYIEAENIVYEYNFYDNPGCTGCSQLKDRSSGTVIRYNKFYPAARYLDLINAQSSYVRTIPGKLITVPTGGWSSGATSISTTTSVSGISAGDRVGYIAGIGGWGYEGSSAGTRPVMPYVTGVDPDSNTITLASPGLPASVAAGSTVFVVYRALSPYTQSFAYGNVFDADQSLFPYATGSLVHYGWDTAGGIDSVKDRAGTLYFYNNTVIVRWDHTTTTGAMWNWALFQTESEADIIRADNNLVYVTNHTTGVNPTYPILLTAGSYSTRVSGQLSGGGNMITPTLPTSYTCGSVTTIGWAVCNGTLASGTTIDYSGWSTPTQAQLYPSGLAGTRDYHLQAGSSAIGSATTLPAAITNNILELDLTPLREISGTDRVAASDTGAYAYSASRLSVDSSRISFSAVAGDVAPAPQSITATLTHGSGTISAEFAPTCSWASVSPPSGTDLQEFVVNVDPSGLTAGSHSCTLVVTSSAATSGSPASVTVGLSLRPLVESLTTTGTVKIRGNVRGR